MREGRMSTLETQIYNPRTPLEQEIAAMGPWFHNLHFEGDIQTAPDHPLGDFPKFKWIQVQDYIPEDLSGWRVLDIGCNAGYYSFELAARGADVLGIDINDHYLKQAEWASQKISLKGKTEFRKLQIYEIIKLSETFDMILFMGVFYHLRYPLLALDIIAQKFSRLLVFQTMTMPGKSVMNVPNNFKFSERRKMLKRGFPKVAFIEKEFAGDCTNWWAPNKPAVEAMLRSSGLDIMHKPAEEIYICKRNYDSYKIHLVLDELNAVTGIMNDNTITGNAND
jgi:tRNA (mo5U34)-methyltransferase